MAEKKKRLSQIEQREKLIKDRAARLAKDAKKQGITPEALLKKKKDTYLTVASPLIGLLPFGAIARGATSLFKAVKTAKKAKDVGKALKTSKTPTKNVSKTPKKVEKKTPKKQKKENVLAKRKEKQKTTKKTDTKKKVAGSVVPKAIGAGGAAAILTTIIAKKKDGSAKAGAMPKSRPKSIKPKDFGMGRMDDFGKGRRKGDPEGGTAPIADKKKSAPKTKDIPKKKFKSITAGSNVGFGPKGNMFPKNAEDRKRLMRKYGGTGSAAAKAAAQGKQGNMKGVGRA